MRVPSLARRLPLALVWLLAVALAAALVSCRGDGGGGKALRLATTTSVVDSGLLDVLLPAFRESTGSSVEVKAVGSGKALELLGSGEVDVAVTHAPADEQAAVSAGRAGRRTPFMQNHYVLVGPAERAGVVAGAGDANEAMRRIAASGRPFVSRGDDSGTHKKERELWIAAGVTATAFVVSANAGMADALARASSDDAFALTDRATFIAHRKGLDLAIVFQGDEALRNVYSVVEPRAGSPGAEGARAFADWLRSPAGRAKIGTFGVETAGEPLFVPAD